MKLTRLPWGNTQDQPVELFQIEDEESGFFVSITNFGAAIIRVKMPDNEGNSTDIHAARWQCAAPVKGA